MSLSNSTSTSHVVRAVPQRGVDLGPDQRPGVPMEREPRPVGAAHWTEPARQPQTAAVTKRMELDELTPAYGTAQPPKGLSGLIRRYAYSIPEHHARHWMVLLLADRVDVQEHRIKTLLPFVAIAAGVLAMAPGRKRSFWRFGRRRSALARLVPAWR